MNASYVLLAMLLLAESLVLVYLIRGTARAAAELKARRSPAIGLLPEELQR